MTEREYTSAGFRCSRCGKDIPADGTAGPAHQDAGTPILCDVCWVTAPYEAVSAEAWDRFVEAGNEFMRLAEADRDRLAEELGVTPEELEHFTRTLDYDWLARRVVAGGKADAFLNRGNAR